MVCKNTSQKFTESFLSFYCSKKNENHTLGPLIIWCSLSWYFSDELDGDEEEGDDEDEEEDDDDDDDDEGEILLKHLSNSLP